MKRSKSDYVIQTVTNALRVLEAFRDEEELLGASELPPLDAYRLEIAPRKGELELWYVENQSLLLDIKILALTVIAVLAPKSRLHERVLGLPSRG